MICHGTEENTRIQDRRDNRGLEKLCNCIIRIVKLKRRGREYSPHGHDEE
jgi:hypothetical protein